MRNCTIRVAKTKALISFAVTAKLICVFGFAYADSWFSHGAAQILEWYVSNQGHRFHCCFLSLHHLIAVSIKDEPSSACVRCFFLGILQFSTYLLNDLSHIVK